MRNGDGFGWHEHVQARAEEALDGVARRDIAFSNTPLGSPQIFTIDVATHQVAPISLTIGTSVTVGGALALNTTIPSGSATAVNPKQEA